MTSAGFPLLEPQALAAALECARDRSPAGRAMGRFRWAQVGGAVWLFPASLRRIGALVPLGASARIAPGPRAAPTRFAFWLATALRQDLWRTLRRVPGLVPVACVAPEAAADGVEVLAGALVPPAQAAAVGPRLPLLLEPGRLRPSIAWALSRAKND